MTEREWLESDDPRAMYAFVDRRMTPRQRGLIVVACGRRHCRSWERERYGSEEEAKYWLQRKPEIDRLCGELIDRVEEAIDGAERTDDIGRLHEQVFELGPLGLSFDLNATIKGNVAYWILDRFTPTPKTVSEQASVDERWLWATYAEECYQAELVREVIGNPFCPSRIERGWLTADVISIAEAAYRERELPSRQLAPVRLSILADALVDAGCANEEIVGHLRADSPHVRGCWVVDRLLGKS